MTIAHTNAHGQIATGITPIECPSWCDDPGHIAATARQDQNCWGSDHYVDPKMEDVHATPGANLGDYEIDFPMVGPCAYRGFNEAPLVYLHIYLPGQRRYDGLDTSCKFTPTEARQLAAHLTVVADEIEAG